MPAPGMGPGGHGPDPAGRSPPGGNHEGDAADADAAGGIDEMNFLPDVPFPAWAVSFAALFSALNLRGIKAIPRTNEWITSGLAVVIALRFFGVLDRHTLIPRNNILLGGRWPW